jgi:hypothetical protein
MFGIKKLRTRLGVIEQCLASTQAPKEPTISIPVVDAKGEPVNERLALFYPYIGPAEHKLTLQHAFDQLQEALGVEIQLVKGSKDIVKVTKQKRGK